MVALGSFSSEKKAQHLWFAKDSRIEDISQLFLVGLMISRLIYENVSCKTHGTHNKARLGHCIQNISERLRNKFN